MTSSIEQLAWLFETGGTMRVPEAKRIFGDAYDVLREAGVPVQADNCMLWRCRDCDEDHMAEECEADGKPVYSCFCPTVGTRPLHGFDPRCVKLSPSSFARAVFSAFLDRTDIRVREPLSGVAWEATTAKGSLPRPVLLARGLDDIATFKQVEKLLAPITSGGRAVLLTASPAAAELCSEKLGVFELARVLSLGADGLSVADTRREAAAVLGSARKIGRPDKGRYEGLARFRSRADAGETAANLTAEATAIAAIMFETDGAAAPKWRTVRDWIREDFWKRFPERRR